MSKADYDSLPPEMQALLDVEIEKIPTCDECGTWTATYIVRAESGETYFVCDKPRCQDALRSYLEQRARRLR